GRPPGREASRHRAESVGRTTRRPRARAAHAGPGSRPLQERGQRRSAEERPGPELVAATRRLQEAACRPGSSAEACGPKIGFVFSIIYLPRSLMDTARTLLFGVLALQLDLIGAQQFAEACTAWSARKGTPLADLLVERGWLSPADKADV